MIRFNERELEQIIDACHECINMTEEKAKELTFNDLEDYTSSVGLDTIDNAKFILEKKHSLEVVNNQENINKLYMDTIFWLDALWTWFDCDFTKAKEVYKFVKNTEYCSIFEKMANEFEDEE
jgi:hypothetical protein